MLREPPLRMKPAGTAETFRTADATPMMLTLELRADQALDPAALVACTLAVWFDPRVSPVTVQLRDVVVQVTPPPRFTVYRVTGEYPVSDVVGSAMLKVNEWSPFSIEEKTGVAGASAA